jgi:hypothetical protein
MLEKSAVFLTTSVIDVLLTKAQFLENLRKYVRRPSFFALVLYLVPEKFSHGSTQSLSFGGKIASKKGDRQTNIDAAVDGASFRLATGGSIENLHAHLKDRLTTTAHDPAPPPLEDVHAGPQTRSPTLKSPVHMVPLGRWSTNTSVSGPKLMTIKKHAAANLFRCRMTALDTGTCKCLCHRR